MCFRVRLLLDRKVNRTKQEKHEQEESVQAHQTAHGEYQRNRRRNTESQLSFLFSEPKERTADNNILQKSLKNNK